MEAPQAFQLSRVKGSKDSLTQRFSFTKTMEAKIGVAVYLIFYSITIFADSWDIGWFAGPSAVIAIIGIAMVHFPLILSKKDGSIIVNGNQINFKSNLDKDVFPSSLDLNKVSAVEIHTIQLIRLFSTYAVLYFDVEAGGKEYTFGVILKSKKQEKQYKEVLDSWYRNGVPLKEFNRMGHRVFKLTEGKSYADIQQIKTQYGITW